MTPETDVESIFAGMSCMTARAVNNLMVGILGQSPPFWRDDARGGQV